MSFTDTQKLAAMRRAVRSRSSKWHIRALGSEVVTDEGALHKFISIAALHTVTEHLACPLTNSLATGH
jgi:hypothetical protein